MSKMLQGTSMAFLSRPLVVRGRNAVTVMQPFNARSSAASARFFPRSRGIGMHRVSKIATCASGFGMGEDYYVGMKITFLLVFFSSYMSHQLKYGYSSFIYSPSSSTQIWLPVSTFSGCGMKFNYIKLYQPAVTTS